MASSEIVATLTQREQTVHLALKLPLIIAEEVPVCNVSRASVRCHLLKQCKVIIWVDKKSFKALNRTLPFLRGNSELTGGASVTFSGDFH